MTCGIQCLFPCPRSLLILPLGAKNPLAAASPPRRRHVAADPELTFRPPSAPRTDFARFSGPQISRRFFDRFLYRFFVDFGPILASFWHHFAIDFGTFFEKGENQKMLVNPMVF